MGVSGMTDHVSWGLDIANFTLGTSWSSTLPA
jgi:hypothetical protein